LAIGAVQNSNSRQIDEQALAMQSYMSTLQQ